MSRILFFGDMAGTGFGTVTQDLGRALLNLGEDVRFVSLNEWSNLPEPFASRTMALGTPDGWIAMPRDANEAETMNRRIEGLFGGATWPDGWEPDGAVVLGDFAAIRRLPALATIPRGFPVLHYVPIEGVGLPPRWVELWRKVQPVAMSEFGADQIERITGSRPPVVYHGVDTGVFHPVDGFQKLVIGQDVLSSKRECKRLFGFEANAIVMLRTDRLMPRKRYASMLRAVAPVLDKHPEAIMLMHCRTEDEGGNLSDAISFYPERIRRRMLSTGLHDQYGGAPRELLVALYNAADIYLSTSAEGFGLTIAEAIACGVPAVGAHYSSVPEVIGPAGFTVPVGLVDNTYDHFWCAVDEKAYSETVEKLISSRGLRRELGNKGPLHVQTHFTWRKAAEQFAEMFSTRAEAAA